MILVWAYVDAEVSGRMEASALEDEVVVLPRW
jgi:hypothetical protein